MIFVFLLCIFAPKNMTWSWTDIILQKLNFPCFVWFAVYVIGDLEHIMFILQIL